MANHVRCYLGVFAAGGSADMHIFQTLDQGLEWCENQIPAVERAPASDEMDASEAVGEAIEDSWPILCASAWEISIGSFRGS
jgi:hypothetical protein